jgi:hypothetical protein
MDYLGNELPSGAVSWSSDDPDVFSIDGGGEGEALLVGEATVWATLDGVRGSESVSVGPGPRISVDEPFVEFFLNVGGDLPAPVALQITNGGGGILSGISAAVEYPPGSTVGWLSLALYSTSAPSTLTVSIPLGSLEEGIHDASLVLTSPDARNSPVTIPVRAVVTLNEPIIQLSPSSSEFQVKATDPPPPPKTIQITNVGGGILDDLQAQSLYFGSGGWLSVDLNGNTAPAEVMVQPDPSNLSPGTYAAEVRVTGAVALNNPQAVGVSFTVDVGPVSPEHSTATVPEGTAGLPTDIVVQARDGVGNPVGIGGSTVAVPVSGANNPGPLSVTDHADGTYSASYTP